jgi:hypothetical protein
LSSVAHFFRSGSFSIGTILVPKILDSAIHPCVLHVSEVL